MSLVKLALLTYGSANTGASPAMYACMTTTPWRIGLANYTLRSLLAQSERLAGVILAVPNTFRRDNSQRVR